MSKPCVALGNGGYLWSALRKFLKIAQSVKLCEVSQPGHDRDKDMPRKREADLEDRRFSELMKRAVQVRDTKQIALLCKVAEATIRNWTTPGEHGTPTVPGKDMIKEVLEKLRCDQDVLSYEEDDWKIFISDSSHIPRVLTQPAWLYFAENIATAEAWLEAGRCVILFTSDAYNDTNRKEVWGVVRNNVHKGVHYIYVIPQGCRHGDTLTRNVGSLRRDLATKDGRGSVKIMEVPSSSERSAEWQWIDHALFFMNESVMITPENIGEIEPSMIERGMEQIYRSDDRPTGSDQAISNYIWTVAPERKEILYCGLLQAWAAGSNWL